MGVKVLLAFPPQHPALPSMNFKIGFMSLLAIPEYARLFLTILAPGLLLFLRRIS